MKQMLTFLFVMVLAYTLAQGPADHQQHHRSGAQTGQAHMGPSIGMMAQLTSELDFIQHMIAHHQEAVDSAQQILTATEREEVRALAEDIIEVQQEEIATLEGWLERWYDSEDPEVHYQPMMRDLTGLTPDEADRAFIEDMIEHHQMAVMDAQQLLMRGLAEHEEVAAMARDIVEVQSREIAELQGWLRDWYGSTATDTRPGMMGQMPMQEMMSQMPGMMMPMDNREGMHAMMQRCIIMMNQMHGTMGQGMTRQGMMQQGRMPMHGMMGQMHEMGAARYDQQTVEALARAFLAGYQEDAVIEQVAPPQNIYTITFRNGDTTSTLLVNADTGEVRLENDSD